MKKKIYRGKRADIAVENHDTAAWANISKNKKLSNVNIPNEVQIKNAKEYVDSNQK